jgi:hypothetical protein
MEDQTQISAIAQSLENKIVNKSLTVPDRPYISGMQLKADVALGDLVLNTIDDDGVVWVCTDIKGWWTHPDPEFTDLSRGFSDGSYDVRGRYAARQVTLTGVFLTPDASYVQAARDKLAMAADLVYRGDWLKTTDSDGTKASWVRLNGRPEITTVNNRGRTEFSIGLRAADPIKYEFIDGGPDFYDYIDIPAKNTTTGATGSVVVTNHGNVKVPALIEVTGILTCNSTNPAEIKNVTRNEVLEIVSPQSDAEDVLSIDTYNHEVLFNDVALSNRSRVSLLAKWIQLDPGANTITFQDKSNTATSTAVCRVLFRSGWIA